MATDDEKPSAWAQWLILALVVYIPACGMLHCWPRQERRLEREVLDDGTILYWSEDGPDGRPVVMPPPD